MQAAQPQQPTRKNNNRIVIKTLPFTLGADCCCPSPLPSEPVFHLESEGATEISWPQLRTSKAEESQNHLVGKDLKDH